MSESSALRVLLLHPDLKRLGGVERYIGKIKQHLEVDADSFVVGRRRPDDDRVAANLWRIGSDYVRFASLLRKRRYDAVQLNPSLDAKSVNRDGVFHRMLKAKGIPTVVFFRGWQKPFEESLRRKQGRPLRRLFGDADAMIVLASEFKATLREWGFRQPIHQEVTVMDDDAVAGFDIEAALDSRWRDPVRRVVFLSRIYRLKGIFETIDATVLLRRRQPNVELVVAGDGPDLPAARERARELGLGNVRFLGHVCAEETAAIYRDAHLLCFPTSHGEGLPNTVVESCAFGLPIVTRPVGGIADFFDDGKHGYVTESRDPVVFAERMDAILGHEGRYREMAWHNYSYAQEHFLASQAARRLETIYGEVTGCPVRIR